MRTWAGPPAARPGRARRGRAGAGAVLTSTAIVIPYRPDSGGPRDRHWAWLRRQWRLTYPDWEVRQGLHADGPWRKAPAAQAALDGCSADILVVADADVWPEPDSALFQAVELVSSGRKPWVVPHREVRRLTEAGSAAFMAGGRDGLALDRSPYRGVPGGGLFVISRDGWERSGGFDPRFTGWGGEDNAFGRAADCLAGRHARLRGTLWHLWHPPQDRLTRAVGSRDSHRLAEEYRRVARDPGRMRELVEAGRDSAPWRDATP